MSLCLLFYNLWGCAASYKTILDFRSCEGSSARSEDGILFALSSRLRGRAEARPGGGLRSYNISRLLVNRYLCFGSFHCGALVAITPMVYCVGLEGSNTHNHLNHRRPYMTSYVIVHGEMGELPVNAPSAGSPAETLFRPSEAFQASQICRIESSSSSTDLH